MQYGLGINTYEEANSKSKIKKVFSTKTMAVMLCTILIIGILLGRVNLLLNQSDSKGIAPFGIAYLMAIITQNNRKKNIAAAIGVGIGYLTINNMLTDQFIYLVSISILTVYYTIIPKNKKRIKDFVSFGLVFASFIIYGFFVNRYDLGVNITLSIIETLAIAPIYYVIKYSLNSLEEVNTNYFFTSEEIVSIVILLCLLVSGIGNIGLASYSIRSIIALTMVLIIAYIGGATYGAMIGVCMGIIIGVASNNMMDSIGFYAVGGLIVGIFKDTGKIFSILAGIIIYLALGVYSNALTLSLISEVLTSSLLFLIIPKKIYKYVEIEINQDKKCESVGQMHLNGIKEEFTFKLKELTGVLTTVSKCLGNINDNENLLIKSKSSALVEGLADRACTNCSKRSLCWEKDFHQTYNSFQLLIKSGEDGELMIPEDLEKKCIKHFTLLKSTEGIINNYTLNETLKERLAGGRMVLANHVNNISNTLNNILDDFKREVNVSIDLERTIRRGLNKKSIHYNDIFCYTDTNGRIKVRINMDRRADIDYCNKTVVPALNDIMRLHVRLADDGFTIDPINDECIVTIEETPKYHMVSYGAVAAKNGEKQSGDNYSFGKTLDGCYMTILSDGMGSGPEAGEESRGTVELVEKFMQAGFDEDMTINTVNSIMGMKFAEDEKYATLDLSKIDLYSGDTTFVKIGAAPTFIKRGGDIKVINSKNLPFGLIDEVEVEMLKEDLKAGDIIVNVSDGILDIDKLNTGKFIWLKEYLKDSNTDPRELSSQILEKAKVLSKGILKDDMTVVVSKIYSIY